jgi:hypothetical protein
MNKKSRAEQIGTEFTKDLIDRGKLVEAGFAAFRHFVIAKDAPPDQVAEMRLAFMAGAEHVFSSVLTMLDQGEEPTDTDLRRMDMIHREIEEWRATLLAAMETRK